MKVMDTVGLKTFLDHVAHLVSVDDSLEGSIEWHATGHDNFEVTAAVRIDNLRGQGQVILL